MRRCNVGPGVMHNCVVANGAFCIHPAWAWVPPQGENIMDETERVVRERLQELEDENKALRARVAELEAQQPKTRTRRMVEENQAP